MTRRTGHEGLHARVVQGDRRRQEHVRATRNEADRREAKAEPEREAPRRGESPIEDVDVLHRAYGLEIVTTRHTQTGARAVTLRRTHARSGFVQRFVLYPSEAEAVACALLGAARSFEVDDEGTSFRPRRD